MDYRHVYMVIITNAKKEMLDGVRQKGKGIYYEMHHIFPKSLYPLWSKRKGNLVLLTAREHYFCHQLLTKIWPGQQMANALFRMSTAKCNGHLIVSSRDYEYSKKLFIDQNNFAHGMEPGKFKWFNNGTDEKLSVECPEGYVLGRLPNVESRIKAGLTNRERNKIRGSSQSRMTEEELFLWRKHLSESHSDGRVVYASMSEETKRLRAEKISKALKGRACSDDVKNKISEGIYKSPKHQDAVRKIAEKHKGKKFFNNGEICILAETCPEGFVPGMLKRQGSRKNPKESL